MKVFLKKCHRKENDEPNLIYNRLIFHGHSNDKKLDILSFKPKYSFLLSFYDDLEKLIKMKPRNLIKKKEKAKVHKSVTKLYNKQFEDFCDKYYKLSDAKKNNPGQKFKATNLKLKAYDYDGWFMEEELDGIPLKALLS